MIRIEQKADGLIIELIVQPKSSSDKIIGEHNGALKIAVTTAPEHGKANEAVIKLISKILGVPKSRITIISGKTSRNKLLKINSIKPKQITDLI